MHLSIKQTFSLGELLRQGKISVQQLQAIFRIHPNLYSIFFANAWLDEYRDTPAFQILCPTNEGLKVVFLHCEHLSVQLSLDKSGTCKISIDMHGKNSSQKQVRFVTLSISFDKNGRVVSATERFHNVT